MDFSEASRIIKAFSQKKILVVGDFMVDEYIYGEVERISPEAPVPVVLEKRRVLFPGGAGNVVCNLHKLGAQVYLAGLVGKDEAGETLRNCFLDLGLRPEQITLYSSKEAPTTQKTRILAGRQQICRIDKEVTTPRSSETLRGIQSWIKEYIEDKGIAALIFSDYDKGLITPELIEGTLALKGREECIIAVDPQVRHFDYYRGVDLLTPNHHEASSYLGQKLVTDEALEAGGSEILKSLDAKLLLITRGEKGMSLFERGREGTRHFSTQAREVFDVTGAGDTVISIFTLALSAQASLETAVHLSNTGASQVVRRVGAVALSQEELLQEVQENNRKGK